MVSPAAAATPPPPVRFYLGTHQVNWLGDPRFARVPLFVSHRRLKGMKRLPRAQGPWALDSGGFTELSLHGRWTVTPRAYAAAIRRYRAEIGRLVWAAPQDWMCEDVIIAKTRRTRHEHLLRTVHNLLELRSIALDVRITPVLQGLDESDYLHCWEIYDRAGIDLRAEPTVGLGTICRRQGHLEAEQIVRRLAREGLRLHAFGAKITGLKRYHDALTSADSMAWSFNARKNPPLPGCTHVSCANCPLWALRWRERLLAQLERREAA